MTVLRPLLTFYGLACFISWTFWLPYVLPCFPEGWSDEPFFHYAGLTGPLIAALFCTGIAGGAGIRQYLARLQRFGKVPYFLLSLLAPWVIMVLSLLCTGRLPDFRWSDVGHSPEVPHIAPVAWVLLNVVVVGFGEEGGWRGYALPLLQRRFGDLTASLLVTLLWAFWHWPLFLYRHNGYHSMDAAMIGGWLFSLATGSVIFTWLFRHTRGSVLVCAVFHGMMDIAFMSGQADPDVSAGIGVLVTVLGLIIVIFMKPKQRPAYSCIGPPEHIGTNHS